jgi:hypothetical protein
MYDKQGRLTRQGAEQIIASGGSVLHGGHLHTKIDTLPSDAAFSKGDPEREKQARERIRAERDRLDREESMLSGDAGERPQRTTRQSAAQGAGLTRVSGDAGDDEPQFAGKPLSFYDGYETEEELTELDGVGAATARKIIEARDERDAAGL